MTESVPSSATPEVPSSGQATGSRQADRSGQATVHTFDATSGSGSVITDDGAVIPFPSEAWRYSRLLTLRVGQRLRVSISGAGSEAQITALTLATFKP